VWFVRQPYVELVKSNPFIDAFLVVYCLTEWIILRKLAGLDELIDLHVSGQACAVCAIPRLEKSNSEVTAQDYYQHGNLLAVFCKSGGLVPIDDAPCVYITEDIRHRVDALGLPDRFIAIHGRSEQIERSWPDGEWNQLAKRIEGDLGLAVVEVGLERILDPCLGPNLCGRLTILETAEVIRRSEVFVGIDSGPAHLANAVATYGIILLGKYFNFSTYMPYSGAYNEIENCRIIRAQGAVSNIPVDEVFEALASRLTHRIFP
jgi:heptosyltransferase III